MMQAYTYTATVRRRDGTRERWLSVSWIKAGSIERATSIATGLVCAESRRVARNTKAKHGAIVEVSVAVSAVSAR